MAHAKSDLGPILPFGRGHTLWQLKTADTVAAVSADNYLNASNKRMLPADLIIVQASNGVALRRVVSDNGTTVVIAALVA